MLRLIKPDKEMSKMAEHIEINGFSLFGKKEWQQKKLKNLAEIVRLNKENGGNSVRLILDRSTYLSTTLFLLDRSFGDRQYHDNKDIQMFQGWEHDYRTNEEPRISVTLSLKPTKEDEEQ